MECHLDVSFSSVATLCNPFSDNKQKEKKIPALEEVNNIQSLGNFAFAEWQPIGSERLNSILFCFLLMCIFFFHYLSMRHRKIF